MIKIITILYPLKLQHFCKWKLNCNISVIKLEHFYNQ